MQCNCQDARCLCSLQMPWWRCLGLTERPFKQRPMFVSLRTIPDQLKYMRCSRLEPSPKDRECGRPITMLGLLYPVSCSRPSGAHDRSPTAFPSQQSCNRIQILPCVSHGIEQKTKSSCSHYAPSEAIAPVPPEDCLVSLVSPHSNIFFSPGPARWA